MFTNGLEIDEGGFWKIYAELGLIDKDDVIAKYFSIRKQKGMKKGIMEKEFGDLMKI